MEENKSRSGRKLWQTKEEVVPLLNHGMKNVDRVLCLATLKEYEEFRFEGTDDQIVFQFAIVFFMRYMKEKIFEFYFDPGKGETPIPDIFSTNLRAEIEIYGERLIGGVDHVTVCTGLNTLGNCQIHLGRRLEGQAG